LEKICSPPKANVPDHIVGASLAPILRQRRFDYSSMSAPRRPLTKGHSLAFSSLATPMDADAVAEDGKHFFFYLFF
jgi:hypothetical protein